MRFDPSGGWRRTRLGDVVTLQRGFDLPARNRRPGAIQIVSSSGITGSHDQARVDGPGVITGRYGTLGEVYYVDGPCWPLNTTLFVRDFHGNDPRFCFYFLQHQGLGSHEGAAAVPGVNRNVLHELPVVVPPVDTQRKIASVLSTYDELFENNRRRIELLEEMAQRIYREWFVEFRYPGHEDVPQVDSDVGRIPAGWQPVQLATLCDSIDYGYTASAERDEVGPKFLRITDIVPASIDWASVPYCRIDESRLEKFRLRSGDIVVARTGATVGYAKRINNRHPTSVFASYLVRLRTKGQVDDLWLGIFAESDDYKGYVRSHAGGAAQPNANARLLAAAPVLLPPRETQRHFRDVVEPTVDAKELLLLMNARLHAARDLLLPRLISGEINVGDVDMSGEEAAA